MTRSSILLLGAAVLTFSTLAITSDGMAADTYDFDKAHTDVVFTVNHLGFSKTVGRFNDVDGVIVFDEAAPEKSSVEVSIKTSSIDTNHAARDEDLRGENFFNVAKHPEMTFKSTKVEPTGENAAKITGNLTMLGVTKPLVLEVTFNKVAESPFKPGTIIAGFSGRTSLMRSEFGMSAAVPAIGDEIDIMLEVEAFRR